MSSTAVFYSKGIKTKLRNFWAAWLPGTRYELGDVGVLNGFIFERATSLRELGIKIYEDVGADPSPLEIISDNGVNVTLKSAGEAHAAFAHVAEVNAGMKIEFAAEGAYMVHAPRTYEATIGDPLNLQRQIIHKHGQGKWNTDWAVITRIIKAPMATVLISQSKHSSLELAAKADFNSPLGSLGDAEAEVAVKFQSGDTFKMIGGRNVTPFFQLSSLRNRLFKPSEVSVRHVTDGDGRALNSTVSLQGLGNPSTELAFALIEDEELNVSHGLGKIPNG
ncbi:hypothetical protein ELH53_32750 (plasmid) [Rhizobium ruizarguesonis]|uniref:hypothetical protein n=1 Tax=Rhizobium ruizarguesonis TaxID=2081791 RepID=UPI00103157E5|nr:hypothetical protein [Rhizobium ruizarguesonis]MBY5855935.1 hypothetical protein [Rhizobium leguminosarum]TBA76676.1 hypothetical protein ELH53_32750 [Rhizobium ruizarguesonis]